MFFKTNICFLQETYSVLKDEITWKNEWGGEIFFSRGTNHTKGVCILINPSIHCQVDYCYRNTSKPEPNKSRAKQLHNRQNRTVNINCWRGLEFVVKQRQNWRKDIGSNQLQEFVYEYNGCVRIGLKDIQRVRHPKLRKFTYKSKAVAMKSRIDYFLLAKDLTKSAKKTEIYSKSL